MYFSLMLRVPVCFNPGRISMYFDVSGLQVSVVGLERALHQYTLEPSEKPFDMKTVPLATQPITEQRAVPGEYELNFVMQISKLTVADQLLNSWFKFFTFNKRACLRW